jgi:NAD(P)-dependent dehydrogenase (short-subunit alcohol dehydrogenase family)
MESLSAALKQILSVTDGLDGIVHAAGVFKAGSLVEVSEADITGIFNINTFGVYRVNRVFLPLLRNRKGRIIILSSETGRFSACFNGLYSMTKYALEAYSDALRRELALLGIRVIILQPGAVRTDMVRGNREAFLKAAADSRLFGDLLRGVADFVVAEERRAMAPEVLARSVEKLLRIRHPRPRYRIGNNRGRALLERLPASLADAILHWVLKRSFCK